MGSCSSSLRGKVIAGEIRSMGRVDWDAAEDPDYLELHGVPLQHFVESLGLPNKEAENDLIDRVMEAGDSPDNKGAPRPLWSRGMGCWSARVECFSWNVGSLADGRSSRGAGIEESLKADVKLILAGALGVGKGAGADVIVVALQEVISLSIDNVMAGPPRSSLDCLLHQGWPETVVQWIDLLKEAINSRVDGSGSTQSRHDDQLYVLFGQPVYLFGNLLCIFCLPELVGTHIHQFSMFEMPADRHESGVKGVVACRFCLYDRSFCFVNCHFNADTSHTDEHSARHLEERIQQMQHALRSIEFKLNDQLLHPLAAHRVVFLLGDTNMRLTRPEKFDSWVGWKDYVEKCIEVGDFRSLIAHDQLRAAVNDPRQMLYVVNNIGSLSTQAGRRARMLREPVQPGQAPPFPPTYKLAVPGPGYSEKRVPAWTDRILYRSSDVKPLKYEVVEQQEVLQPARNITDHNPVYGLFEVECIRVNKGVLTERARKALHRTKSTKKFDDSMEHFAGEQERHFRWRFVNTGRPHIELLAQRIFDALKEELDGPELTLAADKLVRSQQHLWRLVCDHMEDKLHKSLKTRRDGRHQRSAVSFLEGNLRDLSDDLEEVLERHEQLDQVASPKSELPLSPGAGRKSRLRVTWAGPSLARISSWSRRSSAVQRTSAVLPTLSAGPSLKSGPSVKLRRRVCIHCWCPCYEGLWQWAR